MVTEFPYSWQENSIPYLGILLPKKTSNLIRINFPPLIKTIQADISRISKVENSWWGRIVLFKMILLPKILYVFRALPVTIPKSTIHKLQVQMNQYIWQNKKPRLAFKLMTRRPCMGGLGLPDLHAYHLAMTLDQIRYWWHNSSDKTWVQMEAATVGTLDWKAVILDPFPGPAIFPRLPPTVSATLRFWKSLCTENQDLTNLSQVPIPLSVLPLHIADLHIEAWMQKGITTLGDLYDGSRVQTFLDLKSKFNLPETDRFKYQQITHLLGHIRSHQRGVLTPVLNFLNYSQQSKVKGSRVFYDLHTGNSTFTKTNNILKWESEMGRTYTPLQWQAAISWAHKASACASHKEQYHKLLTRWYFTPLRLSRAYQSSSPCCWRSCGSVGSLLHVFWSCPLLAPYWDMVRGLITQLIHTPCPSGPAFFLLLLEIDSIPLQHRKMVCNTLHAARLLLARRWKSMEIPSLLEINNLVSTICMYEKAIATHRGALPSFERNWNSWLSLFPILASRTPQGPSMVPVL